MKKYFLLFLFLSVLSAVDMFGQRCLEIKPVTDGVPVFSGKDDEAGIEISCPSNIELTFESSMDKMVDVFNKEIKGEETFYYLILIRLTCLHCKVQVWLGFFVVVNGI